MSSTSSGAKSASQMDLELYFLIAKFLASGPCQETYKALRRELLEHKLLPKRIDWEGGERVRSYDNLVSSFRHIAPDHLKQICMKLGPLLDKECPPRVKGVTSLLGAGSQSLLRTTRSCQNSQWTSVTQSVTQHFHPLLPPLSAPDPNQVTLTACRQLSGFKSRRQFCPTKSYSKLSLLSRSLGHLSAVYCVAFDRSGEYIFTGADEHLVKVWSAVTGRLLTTMRGHSAEISDMAVNYENTLLASGSCDKHIRVWCLKTSVPIAVLHGHTGMVTSLEFCPYTLGRTRFLASTGGDGCVCFWSWDIATHAFNPKPIKYVERSRAGAQMVCSSFSPGGIFLATGSTDHVVRVYSFASGVPEKICELEAHMDHVDSIEYSNHSTRFISGSRDGTARIWRYERQEWKALVLNMSQTLATSPSPSRNVATEMQLKVTMVAWTADDCHVITAVNDCSLKVWDSNKAQLLRVLKRHQDEIFVLEFNPVEPSVILSAGHDGHIILWDISTGSVVKDHFNVIEGQGHGAVFDCKWSKDGLSFAATDSHGYLMYFGFGSDEKYKNLPEEMFFHTDYRPLIRDSNDYVLDEQTQQPPHLMPPPFLVDMDGAPHSRELQRLVPGREHCNSQQLVPQIGTAPNGDREVLDASIDQPPEPNALALDVLLEHANNGEEVLIDVLIERMQHEQDQRIAAEGGEPLLSPSHEQSESVSHWGRRRSSELATSRSPRSSWGDSEAPVSSHSSANMGTWCRRRLIRTLNKYEVKTILDNLQALSEVEIKEFVCERKKKPAILGQDLSDATQRHRFKKAKNRGGRKEETACNRLTTRALYDTEEEDTSEVEVAAVTASQERRRQRRVYREDSEEDEDSSQGHTEQMMLLNISDNLWDEDHFSNSESSDYSDWTADAGMNPQPPTRQSKRKRRARQFTSSESAEDSDSKDDGKSTDDEPVKEKSDKPAKTRRTPAKAKKKEKRRERKQQEKQALVRKTREVPGDVTELKEEFRPPEWLTDVIPRKAPYFPQMGDEVIYFRQGHEQYLKAVASRKVYEVDLNKNQPWHKIKNIREHELVKVMGVKYEIKPPRLVCLKLAPIDIDTGRMSGSSFSIKYHDMPDVIDFIVLRQTYDMAISCQWKPGDRFRSLIDDKWWSGKIEYQEPFQEDFPDSLFQCFNVQWDNGEFEKMSPWDLEPVDSKRVPNKMGGGVPVTEAELKVLLYTPKSSEWPPQGRDAECQRISRGLEQIMELAIAEHFLVPVDLNSFPIYAMIVNYPIDLTTIKSRLENHFYRRVSAIQYDVRYIESNARTFNESSSQIVKHAKLCAELCLRFIRDRECTDPMTIYSELTHDANFAIPHRKQQAAETSDEEDDSHARTRTTSQRRHARQVSVSTVGLRSVRDWRDQCKRLLSTMMNSEDSVPFRNAVDPLEFHDYHEVIDQPMDLGTIREQQQCDSYNDPVEFAKDVRLVFANSRTYNTNKKSRVYAMTLRLSAMFEEHFSSILTDWKAAKRKGSLRKDAKGRPKSSRINGATGSRRSLEVSVPRLSASRLSKLSGGAKTNGHIVRDAESSSPGNSSSSGSSSPPVQETIVRGKRKKEADNEESDHDTRSTRLRKRTRFSGPESDDSEYEVGKPATKNKGKFTKAVVRKDNKAVPDKSSGPKSDRHSLPNGNGSQTGRYGTRCSTGSITRQKYIGDSSDEDKKISPKPHKATQPAPQDSESPSPNTRRSKRRGVSVTPEKKPSEDEEEDEEVDAGNGAESNGDSDSESGESSSSRQESEEEAEPVRKVRKATLARVTFNEESEDESDHSTQKARNRKKTRKRTLEESDEDVNAPRVRKSTRAAKRSSFTSDDELEVPRSSWRKRTRAHKRSDDDDSDNDLKLPISKGRKNTRARNKFDEESEDDLDLSSPRERKTKRGKSRLQNESEDELELSSPKERKGTRTRLQDAAASESSDEEESDGGKGDQQGPVVSGKSKGKVRVQTRNQGRRTVHYEESDEDVDAVTSVSSRGRVRKLTPRARAMFAE